MKRVLTALVAIPVVLAITLFASDWFFALVVGVVAAFAASEFLSLGSMRGIGGPGHWFLIPAAAVTVSFWGGAEWVVMSLALSGISLLAVTTFSTPIETALGRVTVGLSALVYCSLTLGFLILLPREYV